MKKYSTLLFFLVLSAIPNLLLSEKQVAAVYLDGNKINLDGIPDEKFWETVDPATGFLQKEPSEGQPASTDTRVKFAYDDDYFYAAIVVKFDKKENIISTVSRRDNLFNSERLIISLDSYLDHSTACSFVVTSKGVRGEYVHSNDQEYNRDYDFNPVWEAKSVESDSGWTAEMRIPFSQLRFRNNENQVWGLNMNHWCPSRKEDTYWVLIPKNETGWSSKMGQLTGIKIKERELNFEFLPFVSSSLQLNPPDKSGSPFYKKNISQLKGGLDAKMGISSNFTIDATINPDFGQVEADPAEVNLTAFETIFDERRPFFAEGKALFTRADRTYVYSRRIGSAPHLSLDADFSDIPTTTAIMGAAKLIGRTNSGMNIGVLAAFTNQETGKFYRESDNSSIETIVEPYTFYGAARVEKELDESSSVIGFNLTSVIRNLQNQSLENFFRKDAFTGGMDFRLRLLDNSYELSGDLGGSYIGGSSGSILFAQTSSARYFQRPDADYLNFDSTATTLSGYAFSLGLKKITGRHWLWNAGINTISPGFELNDIGVLQHSDQINSSAGIAWRENEPGTYFHAYNFSFYVFENYDFGFDLTNRSFQLNSNMTFNDLNSLSLVYNQSFDALSTTLTRGGPLMMKPGASGIEANFTSDYSRSYALNVAGEKYWDKFDESLFNLESGISLKIGGMLDFNLTLGFFEQISPFQYFTDLESSNTRTYGRSYIFSRLDQQTVYSRLRLNYAYSPDITLELYVEPFYSSGRYTGFGELSAPGTYDLDVFGVNNSNISYDNQSQTYSVKSKNINFDFSNPDFDYYSLRSNLVFRWEWLRGSTLYAVWQINRGFTDTAESSAFDGLFHSFSKNGINIFALKLSWWLNQSV